MKPDNFSTSTAYSDFHPHFHCSEESRSSDDENVADQADAAQAEAPETRQERVAKLRHQVRNGTYELPFSQLVRILASLFLKRR